MGGGPGDVTVLDALALAHAAQLMSTADFLDAARLYQRVIGFNDPSITAAAMVGRLRIAPLLAGARGRPPHGAAARKEGACAC